MTQAVVAHIAPRPADVGLFGTEAEVLCAAGPAHLVEQLHERVVLGSACFAAGSGRA